ncbi:MAG: DUF3160 domain-containing protein, partial [Alphaproteobacteria bacterium]|nr:DUF3160 domain-containing protein [Alphaproteobacteria bacterium]
MYEPTTFIVGKADDLSYFEYGALMDSVFGPEADPKTFVDAKKFAAFKQACGEVPESRTLGNNPEWIAMHLDRVSRMVER